MASLERLTGGLSGNRALEEGIERSSCSSHKRYIELIGREVSEDRKSRVGGRRSRNEKIIRKKNEERKEGE